MDVRPRTDGRHRSCRTDGRRSRAAAAGLTCPGVYAPTSWPESRAKSADDSRPVGHAGPTRFGLPTPDPDAAQSEQLAYPYQPAATAQRQAYLDSLMPLFDAALGILGAASDRQGDHDCAALTAPWRRVCLPTFYTP